MGRLIDADALKELFREVIGSIAKKPEMNGNLEHMIRASAMVIQMIDDAPTVQLGTNLAEVGTDLVSRQAVKDIFTELYGISAIGSAFDKHEWKDICETTANELPSIQPKHGRWIDAVIPNDNGGLQIQVCDQCNTFFPLAYTGGGHHFCPNCGAKMEKR